MLRAVMNTSSSVFFLRVYGETTSLNLNQFENLKTNSVLRKGRILNQLHFS